MAGAVDVAALGAGAVRVGDGPAGAARTRETCRRLRAQIIESIGTAPAIGFGLILMFCVMLFIFSLFGMLGGLFGALLFRKSQPPVIPPPIPQ